MCQTKSTSATLPAAVVATALAGAVVSSAATVISSALLAVLATMGLLSALGITGFVFLLRRGQSGLWQPAPARPAAARRAMPAGRPVLVITPPAPLAIEAPRPAYATATAAVPLGDALLLTPAAEELVPVG